MLCRVELNAADFIKGTRAFTVELTTNSNHMGSYSSESTSLAVSSYISSKVYYSIVAVYFQSEILIL